MATYQALIKKVIDYRGNVKPEEVLEYQGINYTGTDQVGKLCRFLGEGRLEIFRGEKLCLIVADISARGRRSLCEPKNGTLHYAVYTPFSLLRSAQE